MIEDDQVTLIINRRELTLIRVAVLQRLSHLQKRSTQESIDSYHDTKALMDTGNGKLWLAHLELYRKGF